MLIFYKIVKNVLWNRFKKDVGLRNLEFIRGRVFWMCFRKFNERRVGGRRNEGGRWWRRVIFLYLFCDYVCV